MSDGHYCDPMGSADVHYRGLWSSDRERILLGQNLTDMNHVTAKHVRSWRLMLALRLGGTFKSQGLEAHQCLRFVLNVAENVP